MMTSVLHDLHCQDPARVRHCLMWQGPRRSRCRASRGTGQPCLWDTRSPGHALAIQQRIVMAMHARGMRDTAQVLHVSMLTVITACNKEWDLEHMHQPQ